MENQHTFRIVIQNLQVRLFNQGLLQDSLGGNSKTLMLATMSPASYNFDETISSLRYANRAKNIKNKPKINEDPKDAMLRQYQEEINRLRNALEQRKGSVSPGEGGFQPKKIIKKVKKIRETDSVDEDIDDTTKNPLGSMDQTTISKLQGEVEAEKRALLASKDMVVEEKQKIIRALEERAHELEIARQSKEALAQQLAAIEGKLLVAGVNIFDHVSAQQRELEEHQVYSINKAQT